MVGIKTFSLHPIISSLPTHLREPPPEQLVVPVHGGPLGAFPDVGHIISAFLADIMAVIPRMGKKISA